MRLVGKPIPGWVNRLASLGGSWVKGLLEAASVAVRLDVLLTASFYSLSILALFFYTLVGFIVFSISRTRVHPVVFKQVCTSILHNWINF